MAPATLGDVTTPITMPDIETTREERVDYRYDDGDHERFSHYVPKDKLMAAMIEGTPVRALCGKLWVPSRDPQRFPVCPRCKEIHEVAAGRLGAGAEVIDPEAFPPLRAWQRKALVEYLRRRGEDFLAVATPGAGKTTFALRIAAELLADGTVEAVTVVAPDRAPEDPVGGGRGPGRHPARPDVPQRRRALLAPTSTARWSRTRRSAWRRRCTGGAR